MGYKLTWVYIGQTKVRPTEWHPSSDTLAYYPFAWDVENKVDSSTATLGSGSSIWSDYATVNNSIITCPITETLNWSWTPYTFSIWEQVYQRPSYNPRLTYNNAFYIIITSSERKVITDWDADAPSSSTYCWIAAGLWTWCHIVLTYDGTSSTSYVYVNGVKFTYPHATLTTWTWISTDIQLWLNNSLDGAYFYLSKFILEKKQRTDQEVLDYYNQTKSDYWIS